ncbi:MAG: hypothetical protein ACYDA6_07355, partial [Solirubrobacteraceae bacterium]
KESSAPGGRNLPVSYQSTISRLTNDLQLRMTASWVIGSARNASRPGSVYVSARSIASRM